jgi:hypothetical protein
VLYSLHDYIFFNQFSCLFLGGFTTRGFFADDFLFLIKELGFLTNYVHSQNEEISG